MKTKKILLIAMMMIMVGVKVGKAQVQPGGLNGELRDMLSTLAKPTICAPFFYDMVGHSTDERWFTQINFKDTNNWSNWYNIFDEMKYSAYNVNLLPNTLDIVDKADLLIKKDTIPIAIMNFDYNIFKDSVFNIQGKYFTWDDNNIYDVPSRAESPYQWQSIFLASPLSQTSDFRDVYYKISKDFIFQDTTYRLPGTSLNEEFLYIDFGDGKGWKLFNSDRDSIVKIVYPKKGFYKLKFAIFTCDPFPNCTKTPSKYSQSVIHVLTDDLVIAPDDYIKIPGIDVAYYKGCDPNSGKVLIYLEGNDFEDRKGVHHIYRDMFDSDNIHLKSLRAYNYNVYIVNWQRSSADVRKNALSFIKLLEALKFNVDKNNNEQFVVIGESMGGLIARLALNYMESEDYKNHISFEYESEKDDSVVVELDYISTELMHNTRLFISIDAPHQGAYLPVSIQHAMYRIKELENKYPDVYSNGNYFPLLLLSNRCKKVYENTLQSKGIKQLLIYHINGWNNLGAPNTYSTLTDNLVLFNLINGYKPNNSGMPEFCKNMAISSGLLTGQRQTDFNGNFLPANFNISKVDIDFKKKIFRLINKNIIKIHFELNALPEKNIKGVVFNFHAEKNRFKLRGCLRRLFNKDVECGNYKDNMDETISVTGDVPYDVVAGGHINVFWLYNGNKFESDQTDWFVYSHKYTVDPSKGTISGDFSYGLLTTKLMSLEIKTDALIYNFIPVKSALNFQPLNKTDWEMDIYSMNNKDIFNSTGFDLINGYRRTKEHPNEINDGHVNFVNSQIYPQKNNSNRILQRVIGDDKIYLDNYSIEYPITLTINDSIFIGKHNPNLVYNIRNISSKNELDNFITRSEPITINSNASLSINYSKGYELNTANCNNCIINNTFFEKSTTIPFCRNLLRVNNVEEETSSIIDELEYKLYPNPAESSINLELISSIYTDYTIFNLFGQILSQKRIDSNLSQIDLSNFSEGVYLLILNGKEKVSSSKFTVIK